MINNQKGFSSIVLIGVIILLVALGGYFALSKKPITQTETSNLKTYTNTKYGFEFKYPAAFTLSTGSTGAVELQIVGPTQSPSSGSIDDGVSIIIDVGKDLSSLGGGQPFSSNGFSGSILISDISEDIQVSRVLPSGKTLTIMFERENYNGSNDYSYQKYLLPVLSTFKFIEPTSSMDTSTLPTTCKDEQEGVPVITSLSSYSGSVGTKLEINGCNFAGFEGDKNAWIENSKGVKGILYGVRDANSKIIQVTLTSPLCQKDTSYSGLPCDASLVLTPGAYKIYVSPWSKESNKVPFTVK